MKKLTLRVREELWYRGELSWKLHVSQLIVYRALRGLPKGVREAVVLISRRWGKSFLGVLMAIEDCLRRPGSQIFIVGPDLKQTKRIITPLIQMIAHDAPAGMVKPTKSELTWTIGESTLFVGAFDTALESIRGMSADEMYIEETGSADIENYEYTVKSVLRPTLMHSKGRIVHLTTPPREENHPFVVHTLPEAELNKALYRYTIEDNPLLSKEDIEDEIKAAGGRTSPHCRRELFCEIVRDDSRVVIPEVEERHNQRLTIPEFTHFLTSIDFGGVRDNHAIILTYFDFLRNKFCVCDERWLDINTSTEDIIAATEKMEQSNKIYWLKGTPRRITDAPGQTQVDIRKTGFVCSPPQKGRDSVEEGVAALRVAFLNDEIEVDADKCPVLWQTLKYQMWDKHRKDFQRTDALGHGDALAALVYAFRHTDRISNPYPPNRNMTRLTHYFEPVKPHVIDEQLNELFSED